jgi:hypothetical protein
LTGLDRHPQGEPNEAVFCYTVRLPEAGWFDAGDWLDYLVDTEEQGQYNVALRVALAGGFSSGAGQLRVGNKLMFCE